MIRAESSPTLDHIAGDAREAYPDNLGIDQYERHLIFVKPDVLLVLDEIRLKEPRAMELRFHPEQQSAEQAGGAFLLKGKSSLLRLAPLTTDGVETDAGEISIVDRHGGKDVSMFTIRLAQNAAYWRNAVAISWSAAADQPAEVELVAQGDRWTFRCGPRQVLFDWTTRRVLESPEK